MSLPARGVAYTFYLTLVSVADPATFQVDPTMATGDFKISKDGGAFADLATLPVVAPAGSVMVKVALTAAEMTADNVNILGVDLADDEWQDVVAAIEVPLGNIDDLYQLQGLDPANPLTVTSNTRDAGSIHQDLTGDGTTTTTVTRTT